MKKIGVLLHGNGVFDGSEIHEAVFTLLAIAEAGAEAICFAPNVLQHHVLDHLTGLEMPETRNVLVESARITRGTIKDIIDIKVSELDGLVMPGGFGTAKNITKWAFEGAQCAVLESVKTLIVELVRQGKPIVGLCMSPTTIAKALEGTEFQAHLSVGTTKEASPYDIAAISAGIESIGHVAEMTSVREIMVDNTLKIITAPCYMMEAGIVEVRENIKTAVEKLISLT
ncbi:isoprenoid biosynthesis glyoxalase ElbB [Runella slithyformis]|uniref:Isoprenoid biosynthesis protein with amidotransferase-like domain n=1 Tax=Runella slithyformis (strain ATCC 29530 / DSM 19594 / LMG 11500 / NCIMB 11436 / LSU 4) TaxID=761193 RepID=A0A7U4E895_RUNSL|nr:isoprenoid biosynthesis glyoxalase ElbB [Runella slithyformis]AEI51461.1 isoprenoid biosynthesis protein with amidotransferase-like domain [Runella slithyformis DSM 19594]